MNQGKRNKGFGWFGNLKVSTKVLVGLGAATVVMAAEGGHSLATLDRLESKLEMGYTHSTLPLATTAEVRSMLADAELVALRWQGVVGTGGGAVVDQATRRDLETKLRSLDAQVTARLEALAGSPVDGTAQGVSRKLQEAWLRHRQGQAPAAAAPGQPDPAGYRRAIVAADALLAAQRIEARVQVDADRRVTMAEKRVMWAAVIVGIALSLLIAGGVARIIIRPIGEAVRVLEEVAAGDLTRRVQIHSADEVGRMGSALNVTLDRLEDAFEGIGTRANGLALAAQEFHGVSDRLAGTAEEASSKASIARASSELVNHNVESAATATEHLSASVREIATNAADAARVATEAVQLAEEANATVAKLGQSGAEIGKVVKVINSVAQQTKLLALNATIEAASAGAAGKGFAVVANEVKELAKETAKATEEISRRIETIQHDTQGAVAAIKKISVVINQINATQNSIAGAVEAQTAASGKISRNVSEAATASAEIAHHIAKVAERVLSTTAGANNTRRAANDLSIMAGDLRRLIGQFKHRSHAAAEGGGGRNAVIASLPVATSRGTVLRQALPEEEGSSSALRPASSNGSGNGRGAPRTTNRYGIGTDQGDAG
jgi:methyl-accepting chemotaxis protein